MGILSRFKNLDWLMFFLTLILMILGLVLIYSVSLGQTVGEISSFQKQLIFAGLGLVVYFVFSLINYRDLMAFSIWLYVFGAILLVAVLLWGHSIRGTRGWFKFGSVLFQPVELIKPIAIIFLSKYFTQWARHLNNARHIILSGVGVFVFFALIMLQPDFGSASILFFVWICMLLVIGLRRLYVLLLIGSLLFTGFLGWNFFLKDYQKDRISVFLNPQSDALGRGYNLAQSIVAVGSGQLTGKGLGFGSQSQLRFLPESRTDFIFAVLGEELGLSGIILFFIFFLGLFYTLIRAAMRAPDDFGLFLVLGIALTLFIQAFMNISMNMGLAPVTGVSLPLISYGGSYLLTTMAMLGVVQSVVISSKLFSPTHSIN